MNLKSIHPSLILAAALAVLPVPPAHAAIDILHSFTGGASDGAGPYDSVTLSGSKLYGTTYGGGANNYGTVFSMNTDGTGYGLLHSFADGDGIRPHGALTLSASTLYGMTNQGGGSFAGTLFSLNTDGTGFNVLREFTAGSGDGGYPTGSLSVSGSKLYGMTNGGGSSNLGSIFSINTDGTGFSLLHSFTGAASDGGEPWGSLTPSGSKLYGMTFHGGSGGGLGTVFSINTDGTGFSLLHSFSGGAGDGLAPYGSVTLSGSKLYGMTAFGGADSLGDIFSMNIDGTGFSQLHSFAGGAGDGQYPHGSLTLSGSTLYGMTTSGGASDLGTLFSIGTDGTGFNLLESFDGAPADGAYPTYGELALSGEGSTLYGMTTSGGSSDAGVVFSRGIDTVPEPATAAWGVAALAGLALRRRRRGVKPA